MAWLCPALLRAREEFHLRLEELGFKKFGLAAFAEIVSQIRNLDPAR
jgi:hypothetical protein